MTPEQWADKLMYDLAFAAPEMQRTHIVRRFEDADDTAEWRGHIPSGAGYEEVSCSCGWDSGDKLGWEEHIDAADRMGRA